MKVLIYGHNGWIGQQFLKHFEKTTHTIIKGNSRCDNIEDITTEIELVEPTHIISFIGRTHGCFNNKQYTTIDYLEQEGKLVDNIRDNLYSPFLLALLCDKYKIHYTYLGTGCIFKFDDNHPFEEEINGFKEEDKPNFFGSGYSIVKGYTDQMMKLFNNTLNLRIRMPITNENNQRNFITKIITYKQICSVKNSMTVLPELLPYVINMMENKLIGTINLTNPGLISHNEILEMYRDIVDKDFKWNNFSIEEQKQILDADRSNNFLDTSKLESLYNVKNIKESVKEMLQNWKKE